MSSFYFHIIVRVYQRMGQMTCLIFQRIHLIRRIELVCDLGSVWVISIQAESESARPERD